MRDVTYSSQQISEGDTILIQQMRKLEVRSLVTSSLFWGSGAGRELVWTRACLFFDKQKGEKLNLVLDERDPGLLNTHIILIIDLE